MNGPEYILLAITIAFSLFLSVMLCVTQRRWRNAVRRANRAERNLADVFDVNGAGMTLAREIDQGRMSKGDWGRLMDRNPRPKP